MTGRMFGIYSRLEMPQLNLTGCMATGNLKDSVAAAYVAPPEAVEDDSSHEMRIMVNYLQLLEHFYFKIFL